MSRKTEGRTASNGRTRRAYLAAAGTLGATALAGCAGFSGGGEPSGTLTVATYSSWVEDDGAAGPWLKDAFEAEYPDVTVEYTTPDSGLNNFIRRKQEGAPIDADVYVGLNVDQMIRIDSELDEALFDDVSGDLSNGDAVKSDLRFDPDGRAVPYDTGYIALVFDESAVDRPTTFDDLVSPGWEDTLLAQNAQSSDPGRAFLLWTVKQYGADGYLDYWRDLQDNGVTILDSWDEAYNNAYSNGERPMVVSYSTDQVYANRYDQDMTRHQVAFLNDQGYANPEGMARFADTDSPDTAAAFMDFMLTPEAQGEIAVRNVQFPAIPEEEANLTDEFAEYAKVPADPVTFTYDELKGNLNGWVEDWARAIAQG
ncbi:thiamine ABC transporter substrate-binding protein [Halosegnis marinus]|uniref:Thiamine ABC transporter substrate binding subunit n=1 Tax=Halosegnis marinus TaxID=3034023 RepID=A0ABD5ZN28_9EURY|nr:thiamine ABC transporter substrate-binding protein [Halosegnis sp. DT85]